METTTELRETLIAWAKTKDNFKTECLEVENLLISTLVSVKTWKSLFRETLVWKCIAVAWQYGPPDINLLFPNKALETFLEEEFVFSGDSREILIEKKY